MGRVKRSLQANTIRASMQVALESHLRQTFDAWMGIILPQSNETEVVQHLDKFVSLRNNFSIDKYGTSFVEKGMAKEIFDAMGSTTDVDTLVCILFTISDLMDMDASTELVNWFFNHGLVSVLIKLLRRGEVGGTGTAASTTPGQPQGTNSTPATFLPSTSRDTSRLKAACICALSSVSDCHLDHVAQQLDRREIDLLNNILQLKSMMSLHSRCIIFINNLYVSSHFVDLISRQLIPSVMTLLMYNVTNHIKLIKKRIQDNLARQQTDSSSTASSQNSSQHQSSVVISKADEETSQSLTQSTTPPPASSATTHDQVDKMYNDNLYVDFIASACLLLGNLTTNYENCLVAESYSIIDIMTLLFHNSNDHHTPEVLTNVVKCLANLATIAPNRNKLKKSNIIAMAIRLLQMPRLRLDLRAHLILLLANMAGSDGANQVIIESKSISHAIRFIDDVTNPIPPVSVTEPLEDPSFGYLVIQDARFQRFGCLFIANMATDASAIPQLVEEGAIPYVVRLCYTTSSSVQRQAARAIYEFASSGKRDVLIQLEREGAIKALQHLLTVELARSVLPEPSTTPSNSPSPANAKQSSTNDASANANSATQATTPNSIGGSSVSPNHAAVQSISSSVPSDSINHEPSSIESGNSSLAPSTPSVTASAPTTSTPFATIEQLAKSALPLLKAAGISSTPTTPSRNGNGRDGNRHTETSTASGSATKASHSSTSSQLLQLQVEQEKQKGNEHFNARRWNDSISCYSRAIALGPSNLVMVQLYSNRSAAYTQLAQFQAALSDSERCIELQRDWVKGHFRRGKALLGLHNYAEAIVSLKEALNCDRGSKEIQDALRAAVAKAKEMEFAQVSADFCHLNADAILTLLKHLFSKPTLVKVPMTIITSEDPLIPSSASVDGPTSTPGSVTTTASAKSTATPTTTDSVPPKKVEIGIEHVSQLLIQLFELLKAWYDPNSTDTLHSRLMGDIEPEDVGLQLHEWATRVNIHQLMQAKGMDFVLFHLDLGAPCAKRLSLQYPDDETRWYVNQDLSCYQFGFFVTTILTRLVIEGHKHWAIGALKRLIQLNSDRLVRLSIGTPLSQAAIQVTGQGSWGLPKMPWLRQLFLTHGGVRCIAMDSFEGHSYDKLSINFLHSITPTEWLGMPQDQLDCTIEWTVLPIFNEGETGNELQKTVEIWATLFSIQGTRHNLLHYVEKYKEPAFIQFVLAQMPTAVIPPVQAEPGVLPPSSNEARQYALAWAKQWLQMRR